MRRRKVFLPFGPTSRKRSGSETFDYRHGPPGARSKKRDPGIGHPHVATEA